MINQGVYKNVAFNVFNMQDHSKQSTVDYSRQTVYSRKHSFNSQKPKPSIPSYKANVIRSKPWAYRPAVTMPRS